MSNLKNEKKTSEEFLEKDEEDNKKGIKNDKYIRQLFEERSESNDNSMSLRSQRNALFGLNGMQRDRKIDKNIERNDRKGRIITKRCM